MRSIWSGKNLIDDFVFSLNCVFWTLQSELILQAVPKNTELYNFYRFPIDGYSFSSAYCYSKLPHCLLLLFYQQTNVDKGELCISVIYKNTCQKLNLFVSIVPFKSNKLFHFGTFPGKPFISDSKIGLCPGITSSFNPSLFSASFFLGYANR